MIKYRTRLLFGLITLIVFVLIGLSLLLGHFFKSYYLHSFDERLTKESQLIAEFIRENGGLKNVGTAKIKQYSDLLDSRISIITNDGLLVFDSADKTMTQHEEHVDIINNIYKNRLNDKGKEAVLDVNGDADHHYYWSPIISNDQIEGYLFLSAKLTEVQKATRQIWGLLIISLGFALIVLILVSVRITSRYTKPVEAATKVAIELAKGNYRARTYENRYDETGMLSSSVNILARNLQTMVKDQEIQQNRLETLIENMGSGLILIDSRGYIILSNHTYHDFFHVKQENLLNQLYHQVIEHREITEIVEEIFMTEEKIRKQLHLAISIERRYFEVYGVPILGANDEWKGVLLVFHDITEIKKLEQIRKDFVGNVSHELKTPVTSIKGFSETLLDGAMNDKNTLEAFLTIILKESDRLQSLIQDLLDLSKIEQQGYSLNVEQVNVVHILEEVLPILERKAKEKNIQLCLETEKNNIEIEGDSSRLKQVFINLITNAITYTPNEGKVLISVEKRGNAAVTTIKDTGIGIEKEEIPRIFERFYRVDKARSRNSGGTGLGLAIVKHLIEAHKGRIDVDSEVGKGTTFTIELQETMSQKGHKS